MSRTFRFTIAEDDQKFQILIEYLLSRAFPGSSFAMFSNAEDALSHIHNSGTDFLITDHGMGTMSGTELIRGVRREHNPVPIMMVSGDERAQSEALTAGANEFLHKDHVWKHLVEHVSKY